MDDSHDHSHGALIDDEPAGIPAESIDGAFAPRPRPGLIDLEIDGEAVLVEEETGAVRHLDPVGSIVWASFDGASTIQEISTDLAAGFRADPEVVRSDVIALARTLGGQGLLEGVARDLPPQVQQPAGFPTGTQLPGFALDTLDGGRFDLEAERGRRLMLVHWSPHCGFCDRIAPDLIELAPHLEQAEIDLVLISIGDRDANAEKLATLGVQTRLALKESIDPEADPFSGQGTPAAYLIDANGVTVSEMASGAFEVPTLLHDAAGIAAPMTVVAEPESEPDAELAPVVEDRSQPKFLIEPKSS